MSFNGCKKSKIAGILTKHKSELRAKYGAKRIGLFGSVTKGTSGPHSDVDVFIEFERPVGFEFFALWDFLERLLGRRVDIVTRAGLDALRVKSVASEIRKGIRYV